MVVDRETRISDILWKYPETRQIFLKHGMACVNCMGSDQETIQTGALMHDINVELLLRELNGMIEQS